MPSISIITYNTYNNNIYSNNELFLLNFKRIHPEPVSELVVQDPKTMGRSGLRSTLYMAYTGDIYPRCINVLGAFLIVMLLEEVCFNIQNSLMH